MSNKIKFISTLSRKAKINILAVMVLLFISATVFLSINQITTLLEKREKVVELEERLAWVRNENIKLLADEKSLYTDEGIQREARSQFNMTLGDERNYFLLIQQTSQDSQERKHTYQPSNLWENIKVFYHQEIKE